MCACNAPPPPPQPDPVASDKEKEEAAKTAVVVDPSVHAQVQVATRTTATGYQGVHRVEATSRAGVKWVKINEVSVFATKADDFANPFASPWIELYSRESQTIDLVGYRLGIDPSTGFEGALPLPKGAFIEYEGYLAVFANKKDQGRPVLPLQLTSPGQLMLWDPEGNLVDHIQWLAHQMPVDGSITRVPDGGPGFAILSNSRPMRRIKPMTHEDKQNFSAFGRRAK
jgi:hypothetical protein